MALPALLVGLGVVSGCGSQSDAPASPTAPTIPVWEVPLDDARLESGRLVWRETCRNCHGTGLAGAPKIGDRTAWKPRIAKGIETLVEHAQQGFQGPAGTEMPARGGNPALTDDEIARAVAFVVSQSS